MIGSAASNRGDWPLKVRVACRFDALLPIMAGAAAVRPAQRVVRGAARGGNAGVGAVRRGIGPVIGSRASNRGDWPLKVRVACRFDAVLPIMAGAAALRSAQRGNALRGAGVVRSAPAGSARREAVTQAWVQFGGIGPVIGSAASNRGDWLLKVGVACRFDALLPIMAVGGRERGPERGPRAQAASAGR